MEWVLLRGGANPWLMLSFLSLSLVLGWLSAGTESGRSSPYYSQLDARPTTHTAYQAPKHFHVPGRPLVFLSFTPILLLFLQTVLYWSQTYKVFQRSQYGDMLQPTYFITPTSTDCVYYHVSLHCSFTTTSSPHQSWPLFRLNHFITGCMALLPCVVCQ